MLRRLAKPLRKFKITISDLLLCDLNIEREGDGYDVVRAMQEANPKCAVLILTAYPAVESAIEGIHLRIDDYIIKPSNADALVACWRTNYLRRAFKRPTRNVYQSSGGFAIPQTLPGSSSASPRSQNFSYSPSEMQFTTPAVTLRFAGRPSNRTCVPTFSGRPNRAPHPCGFASIAKHGSKKGWAESRLIRVSRISQGILVPPRRLVVGRYKKS